MKLGNRNSKGESLLEVVIALTILGIGLTIASTIIGTSLRNLNSSKNRVVAVNIAREGLEAMRNIRDTNWLKFNSQKRICWNHMPTFQVKEECQDSDNPIQPGEYIIYKQAIEDLDGQVIGWKWRLENIGQNDVSGEAPPCSDAGLTYFDTDKNLAFVCDGGLWVERARLSLIDTDPLVDTDEDGLFDNDRDAYNHALVLDLAGALGSLNAQRSTFNRSLTVEYLDDKGEVFSDPMGTDEIEPLNRMRITCKVWWQEGKNRFTVSLATHLSDYLGRESLLN